MKLLGCQNYSRGSTRGLDLLTLLIKSSGPEWIGDILLFIYFTIPILGLHGLRLDPFPACGLLGLSPLIGFKSGLFPLYAFSFLSLHFFSYTSTFRLSLSSFHLSSLALTFTLPILFPRDPTIPRYSASVPPFCRCSPHKAPALTSPFVARDRDILLSFCSTVHLIQTSP